MTPFRAVYDRPGWGGDQEVVLVVAILPAGVKPAATVVFVTPNGVLSEADVHHFINCQVEWPKRRA